MLWLEVFVPLPVKNVPLLSLMEKEMAPNSSIFAWEIPWTENQPSGSHTPVRFRTSPQVHTYLHALKDDAGPLPPDPRPMSHPQGTQPEGLRDFSCRNSQGCGAGELTTRDSLNSWFRSASSAASTRFCGGDTRGE